MDACVGHGIDVIEAAVGSSIWTADSGVRELGGREGGEASGALSAPAAGGSVALKPLV
jgi:hypothetical protein